MKRIVLPLFLSFAALSSTCRNGAGYVYVCTGEKSVAYHAVKSCRGLNRCSGEIKAVTLSQAKAMGRRACKICKP